MKRDAKADARTEQGFLQAIDLTERLMNNSVIHKDATRYEMVKKFANDLKYDLGRFLVECKLGHK